MKTQEKVTETVLKSLMGVICPDAEYEVTTKENNVEIKIIRKGGSEMKKICDDCEHEGKDSPMCWGCYHPHSGSNVHYKRKGNLQGSQE